jgi:KTSC domain-containing protein
VHRQPVDSTSIASIGYDSTERKLEVEFKHGAVYLYLHVPPDVFDAFVAADSKGVFFNATIKNSYAVLHVNR